MRKMKKKKKKDFREEQKWKGCGQRCGSTISCGTFQERKRSSFGKIFGYILETRNKHALWQSSAADATLLQIFERYVDKEKFSHKQQWVYNFVNIKMKQKGKRKKDCVRF